MPKKIQTISLFCLLIWRCDLQSLAGTTPVLTNFHGSKGVRAIEVLLYILGDDLPRILIHLFQVFYSYSLGFVYIFVLVIFTGDLVPAFKVCQQVRFVFNFKNSGFSYSLMASKKSLYFYLPN